MPNTQFPKTPHANGLARFFEVEPTSLNAAEIIIRDGSDCKFVGRLLEGWLIRVRSYKDGRQQFTGIYLAGDYICLESLFDKKQFDTIVAVSPAKIAFKPTKDLAQKAKSNFQTTLAIGQFLTAEQGWLRELAGALGCKSADERVVGLMYRIHQRLLASSTIAPGTLSFPMPIKQIDFANGVGLSKIHTSRIFNSAKKNGVFSLKRRVFTILDEDEFNQKGKAALGER